MTKLAGKTAFVTGGGRGIGRRHQAHRRVHQHPGGLAVLAAEDLAALGVGTSGLDPGRLHRGRVGPAGVTIHAAQPHRAIGIGRAQW